MTPPPPPASASAPVQSGSEADQLIDLLTQQRDLYRSLDLLSGKQQQIVADGQAEQLLGVLSERQVVVDQLTATNRELAPLRSRMSEIADTAAADKRQSLRSLVDEVQSMLESIIQRDEEDRQTLEASKAKVGQELAKVKTAPAAINAYKANAGGYGKPAAYQNASAKFTDARG
ncbi:MAG: flagellar export chaperone FlgN [Planctomycetota bacterium]